MSLRAPGAACGIDADHVRIVLLVSRVDERDDLGLVAEALREQRTDRPVDLPAREDLLFAGTALALDKAAGDAAAGVGDLAVLDGEREEVDAFFGSGEPLRWPELRCHRCDECGAGGLLGHAAGFKFDVLAAGKLDGNVLLHRFLFSNFGTDAPSAAKIAECTSQSTKPSFNKREGVNQE